MGMTTTASGLQYEDTTVGPGSPARPGRNVVVHYTGWLHVDGQRGRQGSECTFMHLALCSLRRR